MSTPRNRPAQVPGQRIVRIKSTPAADIGTLETPGAETAIKAAIYKYGITDPGGGRDLQRTGSTNGHDRRVP